MSNDDGTSQTMKPWNGQAVVAGVATDALPRGPGVPHTSWRRWSQCVQMKRNYFKASVEVLSRQVLGVEEPLYLECHVGVSGSNPTHHRRLYRISR